MILTFSQSYVTDDIDILTKCKTQLTKNSKPFDVISLYTNITPELGLKVIEYLLAKYPELTILVLTNLAFSKLSNCFFKK